ncbi:hypothetical protein, partial [Pseudobacillus badius]|uniref:hypothetical protein n=1 Tax=Bacillus badius TaxID=1455 RepID=UPI000B6F049F
WKKSHKNRLSLIPVFQKTKNQNCIFLTCGKSVFNVSKNVYYLVVGIPLIIGGTFLIFYPFEKGHTSKK